MPASSSGFLVSGKSDLRVLDIANAFRDCPSAPPVVASLANASASAHLMAAQIQPRIPARISHGDLNRPAN
jgi:hypothetical protein